MCNIDSYTRKGTALCELGDRHPSKPNLDNMSCMAQCVFASYPHQAKPHPTIPPQQTNLM